MAQPRYADGAIARPTGGGGDRQGEVAAGGPRPWEEARRSSDVTGTGARGRGRLPASPVRVARTLRLLVDERGWPVVPGAFADGDTCSCGDASCPEPGRHALADASWLAATSDAERVRDRWRAHPEAAIVLPVGWCFDLLEVPERGGREAIGRLEVLGHRLPPTIATADGRLLFLVSALDRHAGELAESGSAASAPWPAGTPRPAAADGSDDGTAGPPASDPDGSSRDRTGRDREGRDVPGRHRASCDSTDLGSADGSWPDGGRVDRDRPGRDVAGREEAARDAAAARTAVWELEPWPASSTWLASAAGCRPETSIWVGGGVPDAPDVIVRRSGLLVAPLLGPEPPGVTRWLVPPAPRPHPLPRMEDVLGPIVHACRDAAVRSFPGGVARRPEEVPRRPDGPPRRPETDSGRGVESVPVRGPERMTRRADGVPRGNAVISDRESETTPARGPESGVPDSARRPGGESRRSSGPGRRLDLGVRRTDPGDTAPGRPGIPGRRPGRPRPLDRSVAARPGPGMASGPRQPGPAGESPGSE